MSSEKQSTNPTAPVMTLPDDTPSFGSNYGLDGFNFYDDYNSGVEDAGRLPGAHGRSGLPDGMIDPSRAAYDVNVIQETMATEASVYSEAELGQAPGHSNLGDLGHLMHTANTVPGPVDFSWLEGTQDPERLPVQPVDQALKGIQEAWGQRTDGLSFHHVPAKDHHPQFQDAIVDFGQKQARELGQMAMRLSAAGKDFQEIVDRVNTHIAGNPKAVAIMTPILKQVASEHKLAGQVFVRAEAYPGCHEQKWKKSLGKTAGAQYIVTASKCGGCVHNQGDRCAALQKELVDRVPWDRARKDYGSKLAASGIKVEYTDNPRKDLKRAFKKRAVIQQGLDSRPTHTPVAQLSGKEAAEAFDQLKPRPVEVLKSNKEARLLASRKSEIQKLAKSGYFNSSQLAELMGEKCPETLATKAAKIVQDRATRQSTYEGATFVTHQSESQERKASVQEIRHVVRWASQQMSAGLFGSGLNNALMSKFGERLLSESQDKLQLVRNAHEGLSGQVYIHAQAFVKGDRNDGCAAGAKKVASQGLRNVLAMSRCGGCLKNIGGHCAVYKGKLVASAPVRDVKAYQREKLASGGQRVALNVYANGLVSSEGGSVHSVEVNPVSEFGLTNDSLKDIQFDSESDAKPLRDSDFTFGGMEI